MSGAIELKFFWRVFGTLLVIMNPRCGAARQALVVGAIRCFVNTG
jgi:hypothetical protein